ncbi:hypothetical protein BDN71DRAFT_1440223 [Pleurotus eryngii]|uniref:PH domain-containing protein n=1 Tax=Pleurotus eryngii TaxID=5323 RepID=A0A9P6DDF9_PLEER|nr:hypothetical protein BDN71DRAFT_1440223 [Pleurotus eryngii]
MPDPQLPTRTTDNQTGRTSRFLEKVSLLRGRIRFPARKSRYSTDPAGGTSPYLRQTRSMDAGMHIVAKPYMSQPLLGLHNMDMNDNEENEGSDRSGSPRSSTSRAHAVRRDFSAPRRNIDGLPTDQSVTSFILPVPVPPSAPTHTTQRPHTSSGLQASGIPGRMFANNPSHVKALSPSLRLDNLPSPSHRFGANGVSDARLSPTIISRQPPLPILNLPKLVVSSPDSPAQARTAGRNGQLRSMPALPLRGQDEPRDDDDGSESDDDDEFHDAQNDDLEDGADTPMRRPRGSMDSVASLISGAHASEQFPSSLRHGPHLLPEVDVSRIDLSFIGDDAAPRTGKGKGKAREPESDPSQTPALDDYFSAKALTSQPRTPHAASFEIHLSTTPQDRRPGISKHASRSMIDLVSIANRNKPTREATDEAAEGSELIIAEEPLQFASIKGKGKDRDSTRSGVNHGALVHERRNPSPSRDTLTPPRPLQRRRSMPTFTASTEPPPYPAFPPHPHRRPLAHPRDDVVEGSETLPRYSNDIYLKSVMPRKMEFSKPGIMARDRKWRRVICELEGTVFRVYECPPELAGVSVIGGWWEKKVGVGDVTESAAGKGASTSNGRSKEEKIGDRELLTVAKVEDEAASGRVQTHVQVALPPDTTIQLHPPEPSPPPNQPRSKTTSASSRSRLGVVGQLLKPQSRSHYRSQSDVPSSGIPRSSSNTPRSSLSIARPSTSSSSMSRPSSFLADGPSSATSSTAPTSSSSSRSHFRSGSSPTTINSSKSQTLMTQSNPHERRTSELDLIKAYTLQHAESGLGNDYVKRKNVIRVRLEGEQFLLQAKDMTDVVAWIEGFQAASNIALDLDERIMPRGPLFPRRRRRRAARREATQPQSTGVVDTPS